MAKYTPTLISTTLSNSAATQINNNLNRISEALENTLSRDGETPNQATADYDLNNNDLLNVKNLDAGTLTIDGVPAQAVDLANALKISNNLSDVLDVATARSNLGLGDIVTLDQVDFVKSYPSPTIQQRFYDGLNLVSINKDIGQGNSVIDTNAMLEAAEYFGNTSGTVYQQSNGGTLYLGKHVLLLSQSILFESAGVRVLGEGLEATKLYATQNLDVGVGSARGLLQFKQSNDLYSDVGPSVEDLFIDMQGFRGHGVWWEKPYDGFSPKNVSVYGVHPDYNAFRINKNPDNTDPVSQTATLINLIGAHAESTTATGSIFYLDNLQEAVLVNCKAFGSIQGVSETKADCYGFELVDSRGINLVGCSSAFSKKHGIRVVSATRPCSGITVTGHTYETIDGCLKADGDGVVGNVTHVYHSSPRFEGAVTNASLGTFDLNRVQNAEIDALDKSVNVDANCEIIGIHTTNHSAITTTGSQVTIWGNSSSANGSKARIKAPSIRLSTIGEDAWVDLTSGIYEIKVSGVVESQIQHPFGANGTALWIVWNNAGTPVLAQVVRDSGTGNLRIP